FDDAKMIEEKGGKLCAKGKMEFAEEELMNEFLYTEINLTQGPKRFLLIEDQLIALTGYLSEAPLYNSMPMTMGRLQIINH
ncbi:hypothetical protein M8C21_012346, partial [Ambrosia artemisiifolia]